MLCLQALERFGVYMSHDVLYNIRCLEGKNKEEEEEEFCLFTAAVENKAEQ